MTPDKEGETISNAAANGQLRRSLQRSEPRRLFIILIVLLLLAGLTVFRHEANGLVMQGSTYIWRLYLLAGVGVYALLMMFSVGRANRHGELMHPAYWPVTTTLELLVPTLALGIVQFSEKVDAQSALAAPALLMYGIFIVLTILRMRPGLCVLAGLVAGLGHLLLALWKPELAELTYVSGSWVYYASFPLLLCITGLAAALVSYEVRKYFRAALQESAARHQFSLLQQEMELARTIQQQLMPSAPPDIDGYEVAGFSQPARQAGGDYYDWQILPDGKLAIAIADVSGHGIGPALLMAVCRTYARAIVHIVPEIHDALQRLNSFLHADVREGRFVTLCVARLEQDTGRCEILSAGQAPILWYHAASGSISEYGVQGIPLGIDADQVYEQALQLQLEPGDMLVFVTDGFYEWKNPDTGEQFGVHRLRECIERNASEAAADLIQKMNSEARAFGQNGEQVDDMTAVIVRRWAEEFGRTKE